jgi:hypothetical protein
MSAATHCADTDAAAGSYASCGARRRASARAHRAVAELAALLQYIVGDIDCSYCEQYHTYIVLWGVNTQYLAPVGVERPKIFGFSWSGPDPQYLKLQNTICKVP